MKQDDKRILYIGSLPPPFGGIASHFCDLRDAYRVKNKTFFVYEYGKYDNVKLHQNTKIFSNPKMKQIFVSLSFWIFLCLNIRAIVKIFYTLRPFTRHSQAKWHFPLVTIVKVFNILKVIKSEKITSISAYHTFPGSLYPYLIKKHFLPSLPYSVTVFGELQADTINIANCGSIYKDSLLEANLLMASSNYCGKGVEKVGIQSNKVTVIPYGIDIEHFQRKTPYSLKDREYTIAFVGHINKRMGLSCLTKAASILIRKGFPLKIAIVGSDHGYMAELSTEIKSLQLDDNIVILSNVKYDQLPNIYNSSYIYVNTMNTRLPCMGLSMKEAMAAELPVIASSAGGIPEAVVQGETGYVYQTDDEEQLATCIEKLLSNEEQARKFGIAGSLRAKELFDRNKSSHKILEQLDKL